MNQDYWFGHDQSQNDGGEAYRRIHRGDQEIAQERKNTIWLYLHWSNGDTEWGANLRGSTRCRYKNSLVSGRSERAGIRTIPTYCSGLDNEPYGV